MIHRPQLVIVCVGAGVLGYCLLAFGTSSRAAQVLGLPVVGLLVLPIARYSVGGGERRDSHLVTAVFVVLALGIVAEGYALARLAQRESEPYRGQADSELRARIRELVEQGSWAAAVQPGEGVGSADDPQVLLDIGYAHQRLGDAPLAKEIRDSHLYVAMVALTLTTPATSSSIENWAG